MPLTGIDFQNVTFSYPGTSAPLIEQFTCRFHKGWTGVVGANGSGKSTLLMLATGLLTPDSGIVRSSAHALYCEQRTDEPPVHFDELLHNDDRDAVLVKADLDIKPDWLDRWQTLSHGERKRAQIGVMLWRRPDALAVDEPTNHLDTAARSLVTAALKKFRGVGLIISHDRELLDLLCDHCLFVDPPEIALRRGGFTKAWEASRRESLALERRLKRARAERKKVERESARRRDEASIANQKRSKRALAPKDSDGREKIDRARVSGKDAVAGKLYRQIQGRVRQARERERSIKTKKTYDMGIWLPGSRSKRDRLFEIEAEILDLGGHRFLRHTGLVMKPDDRIALTGPNGTGKSTLVRRIISSVNVPEARLTYIPQEINAFDSARILDRAKTLSKKMLGVTMTAISRLGSRPHRLLESAEPSPGEIRKLLLAMGIAREPHLIVMDEPTNHMDLPSIQCLEDALQDCPCGLVLVSHDVLFLSALTTKRWDIGESVGERDAVGSRAQGPDSSLRPAAKEPRLEFELRELRWE
ncbi:MAG: ABC-F family ATP-binding cassette domain-containing protein [Candidatus Latescibacterota bacterium]|nr:MAG: ABC-F family ATP-binding cassette domain-containing protein [Candidatus Latescibacterota bacterium]